MVNYIRLHVYISCIWHSFSWLYNNTLNVIDIHFGLTSPDCMFSLLSSNSQGFTTDSDPPKIFFVCLLVNS